MPLKLEAWKQIGAPDHILDWVENGAPIPFRPDFPPEIHLKNRVSGAKEFNFLDKEIQKLEKQGAIKQCDIGDKPKCVLPIQCVPKKNKKLRMVLDCRFVNTYICAPKFKQEGIESVIQQIEEDDELISIDLESGFYHVKIKQRYWKYFGMQWRNRFYVWCVLPFGMAASPWIFKKILEPVTSYLRSLDICIALFVDDFLQMIKKHLFIAHREILIDTLTDLGWSINWEKSSVNPAKQCVFVGFMVHSTGKDGPWIQVLQEKVRKLKSLIRRTLNAMSVSARQLAKVVGQCIAMMRAVIPAKLLLRNVYRNLASRESWHSHLILDKHARRDLNWWLNAINQWNGAPLLAKQPEIQIECDASASGWGACVPSLNKEASGTWNKQISFKHSNYRELLTILLAVQSFKEDLKGKSVQVLSDNVTAVAYVNHFGGRVGEFNSIVEAIFMECQDNGITLSAKHLAGKLNSRSDKLSRQKSPYKWKLHPEIFKTFDSMWGIHTVDRFASWQTAQTTVYNSYFPDPFTSAIDAFAQRWKGENNCINPPFFLLN